MKYMGSKASIAKYILPIICKDREPDQVYVEPFVGGCNSIDKVSGKRIAGDINKYLIAFWREFQKGTVPTSEISREHYSEVRDSYNKSDNRFEDWYKGYIGFNGSYGGRFFDGGYAGTVISKTGVVRDYPLEAFRNIMVQQEKIQGINFYCASYEELPIPENSIIYCDIPYANTKKYKTDTFDHNKFWDWCRVKHIEGQKIFISEYDAPEDFVCVWQKDVSSSLRANGVINGNKVSTERLFTL